MARFDGKVVIVTGSSSGIGAGTAVLFAREGAKVTITGRKQDGLEATKRCIIDAGGKEDNLNVVIADVTDASGREKVVSSTVQKWGQIDILSPKFMYYAMAKAALDQMTRSLALELIPEGVRVNSVSPGAVVTRFCQSSGLSDAEAAKFYERFASSPDSLPIREIGQPEDIANIIAFLADRRVSRYIIGQTIVADGGSMLVIASNASVFKEEK
ncbi:oxidoreductase, short chain dehydrogenase/reductase family protein [Ancylostoma ceylanicum]|uniref:Oxidoreductase, short chain dehydrogenase/reductase family protein n=1 Tax=Ancylostoma ceylanicum TaxID=53326 RepID=A0A0D6LQL0_9BILA|nr:oxidoreductase, short chain dehydrogenase/reductase family protein [Ancylostoma ceylanicum]